MPESTRSDRLDRRCRARGCRAHAAAGGRCLAARVGGRTRAAGVRARGVVVARHAHLVEVAARCAGAGRHVGRGHRGRRRAGRLAVGGVARNRESLGATIGLSVVAGVALLLLWRTWPMWHALEREGGAVASLVAQPVGSRSRRVARVGRGGDRRGDRGRGDRARMAGPGRRFGALADGGRARAARTCAALACSRRCRRPRRCRSKRSLRRWNWTPTPVPSNRCAMEDNLESALYAAARSGRVDRALTLLESGANPHALPVADERDQRTLPMLAAILPDLRLLRTLIQHGVDVNAAHGGMAPLLAATRDSWHGRPEAVMTLLANGADPRVADTDGNTPLHHAARSSDPGVAALLRDAAADIDAINRDGITPLGIACASGNWRLARFLLERGAKPEPQGASPVLLAAAGTEEDDVAGVQLLLRHKAKADARDSRGRSALHEAARCGHVEIVEALLDHRRRCARTRHRRPHAVARRRARRSSRSARTPAAAPPRRRDRQRRRPRCADARRHGAERVGRARAPPARTRPGSHAPRQRRPPRRRTRRGRRTLDDRRRARPGVSLARGGRRCGRVVGADRPRTGHACCAMRFAMAAWTTCTASSACSRRANWARNCATCRSPVRARPRTSPRASIGCSSQGADADQREGLEDNAMFALLAQGPVAASAVQALLRRAVSPAGSGGLARFLAACVQSDHAGRGLEQLAMELLERGADAWAPSPAGDPPLALAVRLGWLRVVERSSRRASI